APTLLYGAPGTLRAMADGLPDAALPDIRLVPTGGGPLRPSEKAALHRVMPGAAVLPFYGATETGYISLANPKQKVPQGSAGRVVPDVQLTVLPENQVAGDGGGVRVVSPDLAQGQVASGGQIVPLADTDGGHVLRDRVSIDADGFLTVLGRSDAVIPVGGMLLDPGPVERRLESLPEIQEAMLLPLTRPGGACVPQAILCLAAGSGLSAALRQEIRGLLSAPERPRKISLYPGALPLNASGKRDRKALMAWLDAQANRTTMRSSTDR
ncbi:MAG: AMP-binding protein, partial [Rhodospirillaceae bacterium]